MNIEPSQKRWGIAAIVAVALLAIVSQAWFILERGSQWHGTNAINHTDEVAYSAYIAGLIRGRPRRSDPFTGLQDTATSTQPESLFSIQMVPAYVLATPARLFGLSPSTVFIVGPILCAIASALALFWLFTAVTRDRRVAAAGVCIVLGFGTLLAGQGMIRYVPTRPFLIPQWISEMVLPPSLIHLPFLRFYQPAIGFPLFFVLCAAVWVALTTPHKNQSLVSASVAALTFGVLVFTYFFLWTAAAAWLICVLLLWLIARPANRRRTVTVFAAIVASAVPTLAGYFWLLSGRASTVDAAQALVETHRSDLFRLPELIAFGTGALLLTGILRRRIQWRDERVLFATGLCFSIFAVFNQQLITGHSLQPFHYEWFIANYCAGVAIVLAVFILSSAGKKKWLANRRLLGISLAALLWATGEVWLASSLNHSHNQHIDETHIISNHLTELGETDGSREAEQGRTSFPVVLVDDLHLADRLPTDAPQIPLWAPHMLVFPGITEEENRERFFKQLYYLGFDEERIWGRVNRSDWTFFAGLFPYHRLSPVTRNQVSSITPDELRSQIKEYHKYAISFTRESATRPVLSYLIVNIEADASLENIDRWYERDDGEVLGNYVLYRLKLRD